MSNAENSARQKLSGKEIIPVGIDDGHAVTKIALPDGRLLKFPSRARAGSSGISSIGGNSDTIDGSYETDGVEFVVGDFIEGESTRFNEYPFSPINRVIVHHALRVAGLGGKQVKLTTSLPVAQYFSGSKPNVPIIERKLENLRIPVKAVSGVACSEIVSAHVLAEGICAWIDYSVNSQGDIVVAPAEPAAVVDIGGGTTDIVTILPGWKVDNRRSGTAKIGVLHLIEIIRERVKARFDLYDISQSSLDKCLQTGKITLWNKDEDISDIVESAKKEVADQIYREVQRHIGKGAEFSKILFVGGGSVVFDSIRSHFPNAVIHGQPEFANARGILKYMMHVL
jgi:plasmid segregation protein ParM